MKKPSCCERKKVFAVVATLEGSSKEEKGRSGTRRLGLF